MGDRARLPELPGAMANRAIWARQAAVEDPSKIEVDHEFLPWIWCEEDGLWYSFDGNYSEDSPLEKKRKHEEWQTKQGIYNAKAEENANRRYEQNLYWSKVRQDILERDKHQCQICGKTGDDRFHIHHILKQKEGGTDHYDDLITVCPKCHKKADNGLYNPDWK